MQLGADSDALELLADTHETCAAHLARVRRRLRSMDRGAWRGPAARRWWSSLETVLLPGLATAGAASTHAARELRRHARSQRAASTAPPARTVHRFDPRGDGRWIARVGPVDADVVVILVPGVTTDLGDRARLEADARRVWHTVVAHAGSPSRMGRDAPERIAVLSWLDYDPPDHVLGGVDAGPASRGGRSLAALVGRLRDRGAARVVLVGHSYGALVAVEAAARGPGVDELVLLGAPGLGRGRAIGPSGAVATSRLWAVTAAGDPVGLLARTGLVHGVDPTSVGAHLPTSATGHGDYLRDAVLLDAVAAVVLGLAPPVGG